MARRFNSKRSCQVLNTYVGDEDSGRSSGLLGLTVLTNNDEASVESSVVKLINGGLGSLDRIELNNAAV